MGIIKIDERIPAGTKVWDFEFNGLLYFIHFMAEDIEKINLHIESSINRAAYIMDDGFGRYINWSTTEYETVKLLDELSNKSIKDRA